jgi:hypothetical protein
LILSVFAISGHPSDRKIITFKYHDTLVGTDTTIIENTSGKELTEINDTINRGDSLSITVTADEPSASTEEDHEEPVTAGTYGQAEPLTGPSEDSEESSAADTDDKAAPKPSNWERGGQGALTFSQISLSNWTGGGQPSVSFNSYFNVFSRYKSPNGNITWENTLDLGYGLINQDNKRTVKNDDKIDFSSKFGRRASDDWFYSSLINFRTQWAPGYRPPGDTLLISNFMAPAYLNISIGMDHKFDQYISFYLSPLAGRVVFVLDTLLSNRPGGSFGVPEGENHRYEFGGFIRAQFRAVLMENITINSRLELFSNYLDKPKNFNVNSDTRINMQINQYIAANLQIQMMYDENTRVRVDTTGDGTPDHILGPRLQMKQVFGLGLSYRF